MHFASQSGPGIATVQLHTIMQYGIIQHVHPWTRVVDVAALSKLSNIIRDKCSFLAKLTYNYLRF